MSTPPPKKVSLKEVAERANAAVSTVSEVLNGSKNSWVSAETRERILRAAKEVGYQPNRLARALRTGRHEAIGLVVPDILNPYLAEFADAVERNLEAAGYDLIIENARLDLRHEKRCVERIVDRQIDGLIFIPLEVGVYADFLAAQEKLRHPVVVMGEQSHHPVDTLRIDFRSGVMQVVDHLVGLGHERIAFVCGLVQGQSDDSRFLFFKECLEQRGLSFPEEYFIWSGYTAESSSLAFMERLKELPRRKWPTAVVGLNDLVAMGVIHAAGRMKIKVPEQLSVAGFDNTYVARYAHVPITSVDLPVAAMAKQAVTNILDRLAPDSWPDYRTTTFPTQLVVRDSTGPVARKFSNPQTPQTNQP